MARTCIISTTAGDVLFRFPNEIDLWELFGHAPLLSNDDTPESASADNPIEEGLRAAKLATKLLVRCAIQPRLTEEVMVSRPGERVNIEEMTVKERVDAMKLLLEMGGFSKAAAEEVAPLSATVEPSKNSTESLNATA